MPLESVAYRRDVDGLRAIAVLLVILYHAKIGFPGGFLGVDIFFVISGYLITGILIRDIAAEKFSLLSFWTRRIRRILPASLAMIIVTLIIGIFFLLPKDILELSRSALASLAIAANFFFWRTTGYFDGSVELKPLLHMWSLSVEEQFYLLYPLYLMLFPPNNLLRKSMFLAMFAGCLIVGLYGHAFHQSAAFYLLPCRAWELLLGGALHLVPQNKTLRPLQNNMLTCLGLSSILATSWIPHESWPRLLPPSLIPCLGTCLILANTNDHKSWVGQLLSHKLPVFVGTISYSLYLWHWPILAYLKHLETDLLFDVGTWHYRLFAVIFIFIVAYVSWRLVEQPFRHGNGRLTNRNCVLAVATMSLILLVLGATGIVTSGLPSRFDPQVLAYANATGNHTGRFGRTMNAHDVEQADLYAFGAKDSEKKVLILGDSQAMVVLEALSKIPAAQHIRFDQATRFATAPLIGFDHLAIWRNDGAPEFCDAVYRHIHSAEYSCIVLFATWENYVEWQTFPEALRISFEKLKESKSNIILVLPHPDQGIHVPNALSSAARLGKPVDKIGVPLSVREKTIETLRELLARYRFTSLEVIDPIRVLTDKDGIVRAELDGQALYSDNFHLSTDGARKVAEFLLPEILDSTDSHTKLSH